MNSRRYISLWSLLPIAAATIGVSVFLSACGGGGGGGTNIPVTEQTATQASYGASQTLGLVSQINSLVSGLSQLSRGRQYGECPQVRFRGTDSIEFDFGSGCYSEDFGYARGKMTLTLRGAVFDDYGDLIDLNEIRIQFQDFYTADEDVTYNGTFSLHNINREDAVGVTFNIRATHSPTCSEQHEFNGAITYTEGWFTEYFTVQGAGSYNSSVYGRFTLQYNNLIYTETCDYPVGGNLRVAGGSFTVSISFVESSCGTGFVSVNNQSPRPVDLESLEDLYEPCGLTN